MELFGVISIIIIIFMIILLIYTSTLSNNSYLSRLVQKLYLIQSFALLVSLIITYFEYIKKNKIIQIDNQLVSMNKGWIKINELLILNSDKCPHFIDTLYFDWQKNLIKTNFNKKNINDEWHVINYILSEIFQSIEDYLIESQNKPINIESWLNIFLCWLKSETLQNYWIIFKPSYSDRTQYFIDLIINTYNKNPHNNNNDIQKIVNIIISSNDYKKIMQMRV